MKELILKRDEKTHSDYSPSGSHRWLNCPGSVQLSKAAPPQKDNDFSLEGVAAHALAEHALRFELDPRRIKISKKSDPKMAGFVNDDMRAHVKTYIEYVNSRYSSGTEVLVEEKFDLTWITKGKEKLKGSTDCALIEPWGDIHVFDLKFGKGVRVDAKENTQQIMYALGAAEKAGWDFVYAHIHICQPRIENGFTKWTVTREELKKYADIFAEGVMKAKAKNAPLSAGEHCKFCPALAICPAKKKQVEAKAMVQFDDPKVKKLPLPSGLKPQVIANILDHRAQIEDYLQAVYTYAHHLLESGKSVPGYKLVAKRAYRTWIDEVKTEAEAKKKFKDKAFVVSLLSPAQLEKVAGKSWVDTRTIKKSSGTNVAREDDIRAERQPKIESQFDEVATDDW